MRKADNQVIYLSFAEQESPEAQQWRNAALENREKFSLLLNKNTVYESNNDPVIENLALSAIQGNKEAHILLAQSFMLGADVEKNPNIAENILINLYMSGEKRALYELVFIIKDRLEDLEFFFYLLNISAESNDVRSLIFLSDYYSTIGDNYDIDKSTYYYCLMGEFGRDEFKIKMGFKLDCPSSD